MLLPVLYSCILSGLLVSWPVASSFSPWQLLTVRCPCQKAVNERILLFVKYISPISMGEEKGEKEHWFIECLLFAKLDWAELSLSYITHLIFTASLEIDRTLSIVQARRWGEEGLQTTRRGSVLRGKWGLAAEGASASLLSTPPWKARLFCLGSRWPTRVTWAMLQA